MNIDFWREIASKWKCKDNSLDYDDAFRKGKAYGALLNSQDSGYSDDDFFFNIDDEEDGI